MSDPDRGAPDAAGGEPAGGEAGLDPAGGDPPLTRLNPDAPRRAEPAPQPGPAPDPEPQLRPGALRQPLQPAVDTRRYRWMIGIFGLVLVAAISIYQFATHGVGTTGVPPGKRLHFFAAPLGNTNLVGDPNLNPPCTLARHDPRALNVCLLAKHGPLVLSFFVPAAGDCDRQVDALQALSKRFATVQFAAVAIHASRAATDRLIRSHHWTIPVAYDLDGSIASQYSIALCPMAELAYRGGIVKDRLIGNQWQTSRELYSRVQALAGTDPSAGGHRST